MIIIPNILDSKSPIIINHHLSVISYHVISTLYLPLDVTSPLLIKWLLHLSSNNTAFEHCSMNPEEGHPTPNRRTSCVGPVGPVALQWTGLRKQHSLECPKIQVPRSIKLSNILWREEGQSIRLVPFQGTIDATSMRGCCTWKTLKDYIRSMDCE